MLAIGTPGQAPEEGVGVVAVPDDLGTAPGGRLPEPDGIIPAGTGQHASIGTPCDPVHGPAMSTQHAARHPSSEAFHLPEAHYALGAGTGELGAIGTPVQVVEAGIVALADAHALPPLSLPQPQR